MNPFLNTSGIDQFRDYRKHEARFYPCEKKAYEKPALKKVRVKTGIYHSLLFIALFPNNFWLWHRAIGF